MNRRGFIAWLIFLVSIAAFASFAQKLYAQNDNTQKRARYVGKGQWASVDFANFTYRRTCLGENVRVENAKASRGQGLETQTLYVLGVQYGDITGDGRDDAVVDTMCEIPRASPGAYPRGIYVYEIVHGRPRFLTEFGTPTFNRDNLPPGFSEFELAGLKVADRLLLVEHYAGSAHCCPTLYVTRAYRWNGSSWTQVMVKTRPRETR